MATALPVILAVASAAEQFYSADQQREAAANASGNAAKLAEQQANAQRQQAALQAAQQKQTTGSDISSQLKARIAAGESTTPGLAPSFYGAEFATQYPGFSDLINSVVSQNANSSGTGQ